MNFQLPTVLALLVLSTVLSATTPLPLPTPKPEQPTERVYVPCPDGTVGWDGKC